MYTKWGAGQARLSVEESPGLTHTYRGPSGHWGESGLQGGSRCPISGWGAGSRGQRLRPGRW